MHFYIPEIIFSLFFLSGTPPRVAAIASDAIVWPIYVMIDRARSYPCVVRLDEVVRFDADRLCTRSHLSLRLSVQPSILH